jgi:phenylacetate-coenzyme A ligase PaaK-like adenylate-forming protein
LRTLQARAQPAGDPDDRPDFYDPGQLLLAAWDVWFCTHAGAQHVRRVAEHRLDGLIALAREHSPFYRNLYRGLPAGQCSIECLPVVRKAELMAHFDAAVTDPRVTAARVRRFLEDERLAGHPLLDRYAVWVSSGTTGEPGMFVHDGRALAVYEVLQAVRFRHAGVPTPLSAVFLATDRYALVGATGGHFAGYATIERLRLLHPWLADRVRTFSILQPLAALTARLNEYRPTLLATYPTAASLLAEEQRAGRLAIRPREVWTGGEQLTSAQRTGISEAFGCKVRDDYGASECLSIAWDCGRGALHVNADWVILEPVDERYRRVPAGVASHTVLITNLANRVLPLIRYDLGDSVTLLDGPCDCGSQLPAIRVEGRCDDILAVTGADGRTMKLLPLALTTVLEDQAGVHRFQLLQVDASTLVLDLDPRGTDASAVPRCRQALARFLQDQGAENVQVHIELRPVHQHPVSGKLRRVVAARY